MDFIEANLIIAEFDGYISEHKESRSWFKKDLGDDRYDIRHKEQFYYHEDWNHLLPIVHRIEQVCEGVPAQLINLSLFSERDEVYSAVIEFIIEYNKN
jgi:hypothetical protein